VAEFLVAGGHKRIAHIAGWHGSSTGRDRQRGFVEALADLDGELVAISDGMYDRDTAAKAARDLLKAQNPPDAIFVGNDHMAFAVIDVIRDHGLRLATDISVVGYDDVPLAAWGAYNLTTVRQPLNRMVDATVDTLLAQIEDPNRPPQKIEIDGPLILRTSARLPKDKS
jgi:DNA-binding LacI/PurR family transcriptional regulator